MTHSKGDPNHIALHDLPYKRIANGVGRILRKVLERHDCYRPSVIGRFPCANVKTVRVCRQNPADHRFQTL